MQRHPRAGALALRPSALFSSLGRMAKCARAGVARVGGSGQRLRSARLRCVALRGYALLARSLARALPRVARARLFAAFWGLF